MDNQVSQVTLVGKAMSRRQKMEYIRSFEFPYMNEFAKFEKIRKIGQGTFGEVWKGKNRITKEIVAMKKILPDNQNEGFPITAIREVRILKEVSHENIVKMKTIVTDKVVRNDKIKSIHYLILEFCEHDLAGLLSEKKLVFHLAEIKSLIKQLLLGLHYLHINKMLHRDVKSSNVLVTKEGVLKLADFGLSLAFSEKRPMTNRVVTLWYRAPELLLGERYYTPKIDIWGAGCIMAEMWLRRPILQGSSEQAQLNCIANLCGSINTEVWPEVDSLNLFGKVHLQQGHPRRVIPVMEPLVKDKMASNLLDRLLTLDPRKRLDTDGALDHDFFYSEPMPSTTSQIKGTLAKLGDSLFEYFANRRPNAQQDKPARPQQQQQQQQLQYRRQQYQQQQQQRPGYSFNMADANYLEPIF